MISKYAPKLQMNSKCVSRTKVCTGALSASGCAVGEGQEGEDLRAEVVVGRPLQGMITTTKGVTQDPPPSKMTVQDI